MVVWDYKYIWIWKPVFVDNPSQNIVSKLNQTVTDFLKAILEVNKMVKKYQTHAIFVSPMKRQPDTLNI